MKRTLIILLMLTSALFVANAQTESVSKTFKNRIHAGVVFPVGDASDGASTGFNVGYKYYAPTSVKNLSIPIGIEGFYNGLNSDIKDYYEDYYSNYDLTFPRFLNFPVTVGVNYILDVADNIGIYGEFGIGANFSWMTPLKMETGSAEAKMTHTPKFGFCYGIEGGILFNSKYSLSVRYNDMGGYKYKYKISGSGSSSTSKGKTDRYKMSAIALSVGIRF